MDHERTELNRTRAQPRWVFTAVARPADSNPHFPEGSRVFWGPTNHEAVGTVMSRDPDTDGRIEVSWDGIGTYKENLSNLRSAGR